jgi:A/G-specific adenine glycosylase
VQEAAALLAWYRANRRDLPWRRRSDAWAVWVSEVMLQQTRVDHVVPFYERFLARFPGPGALAAAPLEEVLALWSGLGYFRRARLLHEAARRVVASGGSIPADLAGLRRLPGVGDYTAAAVASIAFGVAEPVLDGNVARVMARWRGDDGDPTRPAVRRRLAAAARTLLVAGAAGDSNQALMELGATVCTPRAPRCARCPLASGCVAGASGDPERWPPARRRPPTRRVSLVLAYLAHPTGDGRVLLVRRADEDTLLAGTWELPWIEGEAASAGAALAARYGATVRLGALLGTVRHAITTRRIVARVHAARLVVGASFGEGVTARWASAMDLAGMPMSSLVRKALACAAQSPRLLAAAAGEDEPTDELVVDLP